MYPYTDRRRLVPVQHPLHHQQQPYGGYQQQQPYGGYQQQQQPYGGYQQQQQHYGGYQQLSASQLITGEPGGFVMPVVPGVRDTMVDGGYGQSPLGFVMPAPHNCAHGPAAAAGSMYSMAPPRPMGEPGGFVVSGSQYPPPPHQQQQEPLSPAFSATSFASSAQQYPYASHAVEPQSFHASGRHPSSIGSMASLPLTGHPGPRDVVSRQGSLRSWLSGASQRSGASETVVGSQMRPKHLHRQHHPPRPESGATFRPNDA